ncbi:MAG: hypothetical protein J5529_10805 [Prevotella sp.]|nr:hypothetical protein [Prevotella sp.]
MRILESLVVGKRSAATCEDGIAATADHVAVIDGSTSKAAQPLSAAMSNGRLAMTLVKEVVESLPTEATAEDFCRTVTQRIREEYRRYGVTRERLVAHPEERLTASVALYSRHLGEVWLVGDCQCLCDGVVYDNPKPKEVEIAAKRARLAHELIASGEATVASLRRHDIARDTIVHLIVGTCFRQNIDFSVVDGFDIPMKKVKVVPVPPGHEVVMATDGYPFLLPTLTESEAALARLIATDPLCISEYLATKGVMEGNVSFDDRAYVRLELI